MFGLDDAALAALASVVAGSITGMGQASSSKRSTKAQKEAAKISADASKYSSKLAAKTSMFGHKVSAEEQRRQALADFLSRAYGRELDYYRANQDSQNALASKRASTFQDVASGFRQSLIGR